MDYPRKQISRGNTAPGVSSGIIEFLLEQPDRDATRRLLDVPCGQGEFLSDVETYFPNFEPVGADLVRPTTFNHQFEEYDAERDFGLIDCGPFDLITCISGVTEFDNTLRFLQRMNEALTDNGYLIVSNDNVQTVRDRLLYLFSGRFGQFKLAFTDRAQPTWKVIHTANLKVILSKAGFTVREIRFVLGGKADWLWLPIAFPLYLIEKLLLNKAFYPGDYRSLRSLICRHYFLVCSKSP